MSVLQVVDPKRRIYPQMAEHIADLAAALAAAQARLAEVERENESLRKYPQKLLETRARYEAMREGLKQAVELLDEVKAQWGADYLWEKWGLTAAIEKVRAALAAAQEPQA